MQSQSYTYDLLGNPLSRSDANTNLSESFTYDALNRLTSTTVNVAPGPLVKSFSYSAIGNQTSAIVKQQDASPHAWLDGEASPVCWPLAHSDPENRLEQRSPKNHVHYL